jgi:hypothetical protein
MAHECLDEFLSLKMEEHTSVGIHLAKMHRIHSWLQNWVMRYRMLWPTMQFFARYLQAIGDSLKAFVMGGESDTFHELVARVSTLKVEPVEGEIVDPSGIFDIQCYKCFINTYCSFEYMILIPEF